MARFFKKNIVLVSFLLLYVIMIIIGAFTTIFPNIGYEKPVLYSSVLFFVLALFSFIGYFNSKNKDDETYEMLIFSLISVICGSYLFVFKNTNTSFALGTGYLIFSVLTAASKIYYTFKMKKIGNELWLLKGISIILLLFISVLTIQNFYRTFSEVQTIIIGYYFFSYGAISTLETILVFIIKPDTFKSMVDGNYVKPKKLSELNPEIDELDKIIKNSKSKKKSHK